ncbi:tripartite tricarboxylate transporter permease [Phytohabitans kaempferiae]|uniref:Tripartite tricarboxylate transporter permease n=1 Tax=Phytohabitans kaempferiae TaxID=1620943 RepID=A0ABV6M9R3_9ACTN
MNDFFHGVAVLGDPAVLVNVMIGVLVGMLVGAFPGVTATMAVALASGLTLTMEPIEGIAVLLAIYVAANFGDRVPAILINTPGTPASIASTFDGYPMAKQGRAGIALTASAIGSAVGGLASIAVFALVATPVANVALKFGPAELFALMVFGLTMMVGVSGGHIAKGLLAGAVGLLLAVVGRDPIGGEDRLMFGIDYLAAGIPVIPVLIGLFGVAEILDQIATRPRQGAPRITQFGRWWPNRGEFRRMRRPVVVGTGVGVGVGVLPAAGGDIAGLLAWEGARRTSSRPEEFGKGSIEGITASDTAANASLGGSLTTTMTLGIPGDAVMAVVIGSMVVWGLQPGPGLLNSRPDLVGTMTAIMAVATLFALAISLLRLRGMVKLLNLPAPYVWVTVLIFCIVGTYAIGNNVLDVVVMLIAGVFGFLMRRTSVPPGPVVLGLLLGPLAESNLRRALLIQSPGQMLSRPIVILFLVLTALVLVSSLRGVGSRRKVTRKKTSDAVERQ